MIDTELAKQYLQGHAKADGIIRTERNARLRTRTQAENRLEYDKLCEVWYSQPTDGEPVEPTHLKALLRIRRAMASLGRLHQ